MKKHPGLKTILTLQYSKTTGRSRISGKMVFMSDYGVFFIPLSHNNPRST